MPPVPVAGPSFDPQLASLHRRLADLRAFQLPRLRASRTRAVQRDLADEFRADLAAVADELDELDEVSEVQRGVALEKAKAQLGVLREETEALRIEYRAALVQSSKTLKEAGRRHELLQTEDTDGTSQFKSEAVTGVAGHTKTNEVTDALRRTTTLLQGELERSVLSVQMLDESTSTLRSTSSLYDRYGHLLGASNALVRTLESADWWDRVFILAALALFLLVVAWVLYRRVLGRVAGGVGWWVGGSVRLVRRGLGGAGAVADGTGQSAAVKNAAVESAGKAATALRDMGAAAAVVGAGRVIAQGTAPISDEPAAAGISSTGDAFSEVVPAGEPSSAVALPPAPVAGPADPLAVDGRPPSDPSQPPAPASAAGVQRDEL